MPLAGLSKHQQHHRMHVFFFLGGGGGGRAQASHAGSVSLRNVKNLRGGELWGARV